MTDPRRALPSVDRLLADPGIAALLRTNPRSIVVAALREAVAAARLDPAGAPDDWATAIAPRVLAAAAPAIRPVLNATGVVLHTNLGRAPLAPAALRAIGEAAAGYATVELDLASGQRGDRQDDVARLLARLTGAEDAAVVNNAAAALVLALDTLAAGGAVAISRGELVEIGGSFRIPDILRKSGARLHEVGTTNRTHLDDYHSAIDDGAAAVLIVHRSNFEQRGFVATPAPADIAALAHAAGIPCLYDVGSGLLADLTTAGLTGEPRATEAVASGADVVIFSGDKLLGGPQAGCLVGRAAPIAACRASPFARAVRADKLTLAGLAATLRLYEDPAAARRDVPVLAMLTLPPEELARRAHVLAGACGPAAAFRLEPGMSAAGGGAFPGAALPTTLVCLDPGQMGADELARRLRAGEPAVIARVAAGRVLLDPRTLPADSLAAAGAAVARALATGGG